MRRRPESEDPFVWLPCLRCGQLSVPVPTMFLRTDGSASTWNCRARPCESEHYLSVDRKDGAFVIAYRRYTLRYPLEFYDEGVAPFDANVIAAREPEHLRLSFTRGRRDSQAQRSNQSGRRRGGDATFATVAGH